MLGVLQHKALGFRLWGFSGLEFRFILGAISVVVVLNTCPQNGHKAGSITLDPNFLVRISLEVYSLWCLL